MSLVQGCEAPSCFSNPMADYIVYEDVKSPVDICDIPDQTVQKSLKDVSKQFITVLHCECTCSLSSFRLH